ncbi:MAG TPA: hypothetical protein VFQ70_03290 [Candidatus Saccharimonadaceae bacterium]|nr:hypothetical protein [Candidatus Saccharimonadaceae bacterium]
MADESPKHEAAGDVEASAAASSSKPSITVKVYAPFQVYFEGDAFSISAVNGTGPFDVLPHHHNFLCMLVPCDLIIRPIDGSTKTIKVHRALMHVKTDRVVVFMDV